MIFQICLSPQAKAYFGIVCKEELLPPLELIKWIHTHWGSMFDLIERFIENKAVSYYFCLISMLMLVQAVDKFVLVADVSRQVPKLKNKKYADYRLTEDEWALLQLMKDVLEVCFF